MVTQCPNCQTGITILPNQISDDFNIVCNDCQTRLKICISLKKEDGDTSSSGILENEEKRNLHEKTAIICIDGEATREIVKPLLENSGFHVMDIPSGISCFMSIKLNPPQIALIDAGFTDMVGTELISQIKNNADLGKTPVIMVTSMFEKNIKYRKNDPELYGADDFIDRRHIETTLIPKIEHLLKIKDTPVSQETPAALEPVSENNTGHTTAPPSEEKVSETRAYAEKIVSDIILFNHRKVEEGQNNGTFFELLEEEIQEGKKLFESKAHPALRDSGYFEQALEAHVSDKTTEQQKVESFSVPDFEKPTEVFQKPERDTPDEAPVEEAGIPEAHSPETALNEPSDAEKEALRLSKLIISDIALYNPEKTEEGIQQGTFRELLEEEILEGRKLYESRIDTSSLGFGIYEQTIEDFIQSKKEKEGITPDETVLKAPPEHEAETVLEEDPAPSEVASQLPESAFETETEDEKNEIPATKNPQFRDKDEPIVEQSEEALLIAKEIAKDIIQKILVQNEDKFESHIDSDTIYEILGDEIMDGRQAFEVKAPAYFDSSVFEDEIDRLLEEKNASADRSENEAPPSEAVEEAAEEVIEIPSSDPLLGNPGIPELDNPEDVFKQMEEEAAAVVQTPESLLESGQENEPEASEPPQDEWEEPLVPETGPVDPFESMAQQAEGSPQEEIADEASPPSPSVQQEDSEEIKNAKRLAKIIVSDIVIYNEDKVEEGLKNNTFHKVLEEEIAEGRELFSTRVPQEIFDSGLYEDALEDYIQSKTQAPKNQPEAPEKDSAPSDDPSQTDEHSAPSFETEQPDFPPSENESVPVMGASPPTEKVNENGNGNGNGNGNESTNELAEESKEEKEAKRLAKIIVSDIVIYNEKKVDEGIQSGTFYELLEEEIKEGQMLYESRVSQEILNTKDYMKEAFENFIKQRTAALS